MLLGLALGFAISGLTMGADLVGSDWRPNFLSTSDLPAGVHMLVHFDPDGKISGNGGCNQFFGAYGVAGDRPDRLDPQGLPRADRYRGPSRSCKSPKASYKRGAP